MQPITFFALPRQRMAVCALAATCVCMALSGAYPTAQAQMFTTLYVFDQNNNNGYAPSGALIQGSDGNFYGTAQYGGASNDGTVFKMDTVGNVTVLHSFNGSDGELPVGVIQGNDGFFYGTTVEGGEYGGGVVFKMDTAGNVTLLHSFNGPTGTGGYTHYAALLQGSDGFFYGTTRGAVFKIDTAGNFTLLTSGFGSSSALIQGSDGNFYGTTEFGGAKGYGTVFKMDTGGNVTVLHSFDWKDGGLAFSALIEGSDGNFYGTTYGGGATGLGTVFKMDTAGNVTVLHSFHNPNVYYDMDGVYPDAALIQGSDGFFYGTTYEGGAYGWGVVFKMDTTGNVTLLHSFNGKDGYYPEAALTQGSNGLLYGTTYERGQFSGSEGTIFQLDLGLPTSVSVSGNLTLQGCLSSAVSSQSLTFTFRPTNGGSSFSQSVTLAADGSFNLPDMPLGTYTLHIKGSKWLAKNVPVTTMQGNLSGLNVTLLAGDVNGDNQISLADYVLLRNAFGSKPGSANWNSNADLNCDGQVSLADYVLLRNNFGKRGDP